MSDLTNRTEASLADDILKLAKSIATDAPGEFLQERSLIIANRICLLIDAKINADRLDLIERLK